MVTLARNGLIYISLVFQSYSNNGMEPEFRFAMES